MSKSATECVLRTPELLSVIVDFCYGPPHYDFESMQVNLGLRIVCKMWYIEASKAAFKVCCPKKLTFLMTLVDAGFKNYGPWVRSLALTDNLNKMRSGAILDLRNVSKLKISNSYEMSDEVANLLTTCASLQYVRICGVVDSLTLSTTLTALMETAPEAQYHVDMYLDTVQDQFTHKILETISTYHDRFRLDCICDSWESASESVEDFKVCALFHQYPIACETITRLRLRVDEEKKLIPSSMQSSFFDLIAPNLSVLSLAISHFGKDDNGDTNGRHALGLISRCNRLTSLVVWFGREPSPWPVNEWIDKWAKHVFDCIPRLADFSIEISNGDGLNSFYKIL